MVTITTTAYIQQIFAEHDRESWCPECLLPSIIKVTYGLTFQPDAFVASLVGSVRFCSDCGQEIE